MVEPPEFQSFLAASSLPFIAGRGLTAPGYRAYLRIQQHSLRLTAGGFVPTTLGDPLGIIYQSGVRQDYGLGTRKSLAFQAFGSPVIIAGLVVIFYALSRY